MGGWSRLQLPLELPSLGAFSKRSQHYRTADSNCYWTPKLIVTPKTTKVKSMTLKATDLIHGDLGDNPPGEVVPSISVSTSKTIQTGDLNYILKYMQLSELRRSRSILINLIPGILLITSTRVTRRM